MRDAASEPSRLDPSVTVGRSGDLDRPTAATVRRLLDEAFQSEFDATDWRHALGGDHVVVRQAGVVVAHAAVVSRTLHIDDVARRVGYVEAVATRTDRQGLGFGRAAMHEVALIIGERYELGVLSTSSHGFYEGLGWRRWRGPSWVRTTDGARTRTEDDDDGLMVLTTDATHHIDVRASIECAERDGDDW